MFTNSRCTRWSLPALFIIAGVALQGYRASAASSATTLSATEAEVLVYVSPAGEQVRARGTDVAMDVQTSHELNQEDYFYFWVYDTQPNPNGSATIGYYAVNKYTADVWDVSVDERQLASPVLDGVQRILRRAHNIDDATLAEYGNRPR